MYWAPGLCDIWGIALFNGAAQVPPSGDPACALLSQEGTRLLLPNPWSVLFGLTRRGGTHCPRTRGTPRQRRCWRRPTVALCRSPGLRGTRTYRCTARSKPSTRTPAIKENTKACSWGLSKSFLRKETRACWQTGRGPRRRPRPQRQPSMNMEWTLPRHRPRAPAYTMAFRVLLPKRTHNGLGNRRTTPSPRGKLPGSPKPPGTWACTAHPEALSPARGPSLEASSGLITGPGGRATGRTPRCEQSWASSLAGIVGNEPRSGHVVLSFKKEELVQSRLLPVQEERALSGPCSPLCSRRRHCFIAREPRGSFLRAVQGDTCSAPRTREPV